MSDSIPWPRFLITAFIVAIATFVFDLFLHGTLIPALFADYPPADYPSRPAAELQALWRLRPPHTVAHACQGQAANELVVNAFDTDPPALRVERGDRVAMVLPQRWETAVAYMAVLQMGAVAMPLSMLFGPEALSYRLQDSQAVLAIADENSLAALQSVRDACPGLRDVVLVGSSAELCWQDVMKGQPAEFELVNTLADEPAVLIYTSGTTGNPKGVMYTHRSTYLHTMAQAMTDSISLSATDCVLPIVPMFHAMSWGMPFTVTMLGAKMVLPNRFMTPRDLLD